MNAVSEFTVKLNSNEGRSAVALADQIRELFVVDGMWSYVTRVQ